jgi:hypothetical protein
MNTSPYEIIIICSFGTMFGGCLFIWGCERICNRSIIFTKKHHEPLLNLLENVDGICNIDENRSLSLSSGSSSGSETTSIFMNSKC